MSPASRNILQLALALPEDERLDLAATLLAASEPPIPGATGREWAAEIDRRSSEIDSGAVECLTWEQVKQAARSRNEHGCVDPISFHPLAAAEYAHAYLWYRARSQLAVAHHRQLPGFWLTRK